MLSYCLARQHLHVSMGSAVAVCNTQESLVGMKGDHSAMSGIDGFAGVCHHCNNHSKRNGVNDEWIHSKCGIMQRKYTNYWKNELHQLAKIDRLQSLNCALQCGALIKNLQVLQFEKHNCTSWPQPSGEHGLTSKLYLPSEPPQNSGPLSKDNVDRRDYSATRYIHKITNTRDLQEEAWLNLI